MSDSPCRLDPLFMVPLFTIFVQDWDNKKSKLLELEKTLTFKTEDCTHSFMEGNEIAQEVSDILGQDLQPFINYMKMRCKITSAWFERATSNQRHGIHNHGGHGFSAVLYLDFNPTVHTATQFISPFNEPIKGRADITSPEVDEGNLIIFPSSIHHFTHPNQSDVERKILSFNIKTEHSDGY